MGQHVQCATAGFAVVGEPVAPLAFPAADQAVDGTANWFADFARFDEFEQFDAACRITADISLSDRKALIAEANRIYRQYDEPLIEDEHPAVYPIDD